MQKGSADVASNVVTPDMVHTLERVARVESSAGPGSIVMYVNFNVKIRCCRTSECGRRLRCAIDRQAIVDAIWRGHARLAKTLLPAGHWAAATDAELAQYPHDVARAKALLEAAGFHAGKDGVRLRMTLKIEHG